MLYGLEIQTLETVLFLELEAGRKGTDFWSSRFLILSLPQCKRGDETVFMRTSVLIYTLIILTETYKAPFLLRARPFGTLQYPLSMQGHQLGAQE